jgi:hypothetical protein
MTFIEWLRENKGYTGDGSELSMQSEYSASECNELYEEYSKDNC